MADAAKLQIIIEAADQTKGAFSSVNSQMTSLAAGASKAGASVSTAGNQIAQIGALIGGSLAAGVGLAVKSAASLQTEIAKISTIKPDIDTSKVTNSVQQMSTRVAQSSTQLADSLYNVFSSIEVSQEGALALTEKFGRGAVAAQTDAETFGTSVLGVMNAYKLSVGDADHISDVFFNTVNKGVITGDELAHNLGNVTQSAKNAGVSFDTLGALIAGVTKEGGDAGTNVNNLNNVLQKIVTAPVQAALEGMGVATKDASGNFRDMLPLLTDLKAHLDTLSASDRAKALQNLFPDMQARTGIQTLLSQLDTVTQVARENATALGVADGAYAKMGQTAASQAIILKNTLLATLTQFGTEALPGLISIAQELQKVAAAIGDLPAPAKHAVVTGLELSAAFLLVGSAGIKVATTAMEVGGALKTIGAAAATSAKALATYATSAEAATLATTALPPLLIAAGLAAVGTALAMDNMAKGTEKAAQAVGGDLATALDKIDTSKLEGVLAFFTGINSEAEKAGSVTHDWAADHSLDELRAKIGAVGIEYDKLLKSGQGNSAEAASLKEVTQALFDEIAAREQLIATFKIQAEAQRRADSQKEPPNGDALTAQEQAALHLGIALSALAPTYVQTNALIQQMGGAAGSSAVSVDELSASYFTNRDAALAVAAAEAQIANNQSLVTYFNSLSTALQGMSSAAAPMQAALDLLNQKVAAGIPLTAEQAHLLSTLPGYIASATSGYDGLVTSTAEAAIAIQNSNSAAGGAGGAFGGLGGQAATLQGALDTLRASALELDGALAALGTENGKLGAEYGLLNDRIVVLQDKQKTSVGLTQQETSELATLVGARDKLGQKIGENTAQMRDITLAQIANGEQTAATTTAAVALTNAMGKLATPIGTARDGLVGLTDGFGNVAQASGTATSKLDSGGVSAAAASLKLGTARIATEKLTIALHDLPTMHATEITTPGAADAATAIDAVQAAINRVSKSFTVTVGADTSAFDTAIAHVANSIPHSPAREGPLSVQPNWAWLFATLPDEGAKAAAEAASAVAKGITDVTGASRLLAGVNIATSTPSGDQLGWLRATTIALVATFRDAAHDFDTAGLKAAGDFADAASKVGGSIKNTLDGLAALATAKWAEISPGGSAMGWFVFLTSSLVQTFADAAAAFSTDALASAGQFADAAGKVGGSVKGAIEGLTALASAKWADSSPSGSAMGWFTHLIASLVQNFADAARLFADDALASASAFAESAGKVAGVIGPAVAGFTSLVNFKAPDASRVDALMQGIRDVVARFAAMAKELDGDGAKATAEFSDAASKALGAANAGVQLFAAMAGDKDKSGANIPVGVPSKEAIDKLVIAIKYVVLQFGYMAAEMQTEGVAQMQAFAAAAGQVLSAAKTGTDLFASMEKLAVPSKEAIDYLLGTIGYIISQTRAIAEGIGTEGLQQAQLFATGSLNVFQTLKGALELFKTLADFKDIPSKALEDLHAKLLDTLDWAQKIWEQSEALKAVALSFADNMKAAARAFAEGMSLGQGLPTSSPLLAPAGVGAGGGFDYSKGAGGGGGSPVVVNMYGNAYGFSDFEDQVVSTIETANRKGRS